jgi:predicted dehydrogenase
MYLIVGSGPMAKEYVKPLVDQNVEFLVIGRGVDSSVRFEEETGISVISGGIDNFLASNQQKVEGAIVAVGVEALFNTSMSLLSNGITNLLIEKPAGLNISEIDSVAHAAKEKKANVFVAYNRRFFSSVIKAKEIIENDGGVTSFNFELTEWSHVIAPLQKAPGVKEAWFLANTTHVADLAFFLGGKPVEMKTFVRQPIDWHPAGSNFSGAGISDAGALFSYSGNWQSPGRWSVEIMTRKSRLIFKPMESLLIQKIGSIKQEKIELDDRLDQEYKPGLYLQIQAFLQKKYTDLCSIEEQAEASRKYSDIAGY